MQGVSINILVKTGKKKEDELGEVLHFELYGKREDKYSFLLNNQISSVPYSPLKPKTPRYYMIPFDSAAQGNYDNGFSVSALFGNNNMGITSGDDDNRIAFRPETLAGDFDRPDKISPISYRPFDNRHIYYDPTILARARFDFMTNLNDRDNLALTAIGQSRVGKVLTPLIATGLIDKSIVSSVDNAFIFPLYLYPSNNAQRTLDGRPERVPNLNMEIVDKIAAGMAMEFVAEEGGDSTGSLAERKSSAFPAGEINDLAAPPPVGSGGTASKKRGSLTEKQSFSARRGGEAAGSVFYPIDLLDYIYAVLHSPAYRERYKEFLKIDFPRVPYPADRETFWRLVELGGELRQLHLLESPRVEEFVTGFNVAGSNRVDKPVWKPHGLGGSAAGAGGTPAVQSGDVFINPLQYFSNVPRVAWDFYIGGYQPAQKWLKDRKGRTLTFEDIRHYQKMIVALTETARVMDEIDRVWTLEASCP